MHGPDGSGDVISNFLSGQTQTHDTVGWPTFASWPARDSLTHEGTYYKWLERAWRAGLRVVVNDVVENEALCTLVRGTQRSADCNEMEHAIAQVQLMHQMQDYIDAQAGGPGQGWFRLVTTPAQARAVIAQGKLAVVMGIEISHLFDCKLLDGSAQCDEGRIDRDLDELYALGIRQAFLVHEFNNALGGTGLFNSVLDLGNIADTGVPWQTYDCPDGGEGDGYFYSAGVVLTGSPVRQCNVDRSLSDLGRYAVHALMQHRMMLEVDHLELAVKDELISLAEAAVPPYPLISSHGGHGGLTVDQARRILKLGGLIYPYHSDGHSWVATLQRLRGVRDSLDEYPFLFAMGYGADTNGLGHQAGPRADAATAPVVYPFTLFQGADYGSLFSGVAPVTFDAQQSGVRTYDTDVDGMAHYGLIADWVEEVRLEGGPSALNDLFQSAEAYLQMWERTLRRPGSVLTAR